jgi:hypothetical protein
MLSTSPSIRTTLSIVVFSLFPSLSGAQGEVRDGQYTSPNRLFVVNIPKPVPYAITVLDTKGDSRYDKVMFHVKDFGQYHVISARILPSHSVSLMDQDSHRTVLRNVSQVSLMAWRTDLPTLPEVTQESFFDTKYGEAIMRVYRAKKGSFLATAQGRRPTPSDVFDTNIASIVARQGSLVVYVLAQDDSSPQTAATVTNMATDMFRDMNVLAQPSKKKRK